MIPASKNISVTSTLEPEHTIHMGIDPRAAKHLMSILAGIYSDNTKAVIREYITNALDSHIEAGQTRPVEVTSPSRLSPTFVVQDFGVGMSVDDIRNVYALYGASTKRETQEQTGSIGIGAKSALAYGSQFTVTAIKDGERAVVLVSLNEEGNGVMEVLAVAKTTEANGVKISIPVTHDHQDFNQKLSNFHMFVTPGKLLVDGTEPDRSHIHRMSDKISIIPNPDYYAPDYVVMGNVAYPVDRNVLGYKMHDHFRAIFYVDMGEVHFTPSREELTYDTFTRTTLNSYRDDFQENIMKYIQGLIDQAPDLRSAFNLASQYRKKMHYSQRNVPLTYKGKDLPFDLKGLSGAFWNTWRERGHIEEQVIVEFIEDDVMLIKNWTNKRFTKVHIEKVVNFQESKGLKESRVVWFVPDNFDDQGLFHGLTIWDYDDIRKIKVMAGRRARNATRSYEGMLDNIVDKHIPDPSKPIWYGSKAEMKDAGGGRMNWTTRLRDFRGRDVQFYYVTDTELPKFKQTYPKARHYVEYYKDLVTEFINNLSDEDKETLKYAEHLKNAEYLNVEDLTDPDLQRAARARSVDEQGLFNSLDKLKQRLHYVPGSVQRELLNKFPPTLDLNDLEEKYPVLTRGSFYRISDSVAKKHLTDYCNMVHAQATIEDNNNGEDS